MICSYFGSKDRVKETKKNGVGSADIEQHHNQQKEWSELKSRWEQKL